MEKKAENKEESKEFSKENIRVLCILGAVAVVLFFIAPMITSQLEENVQGSINILVILLFNQILMAFVGWHANRFPKYGVYIPALFIVLYMFSEGIYLGGVSWSVELEYLQTGYIVYFLRKFLLRRMAMEEKKKNKPFPKGVGKK